MGGGPHAPNSPIGTAAALLDTQSNTDEASPAINTGIDGLIPLVDRTNINEEPSELIANAAEADLSEGKSMEGQTGVSSQAYQPCAPNGLPVTYHNDPNLDSITDGSPHGGPGASVSYCQACGSDPFSRTLEEQASHTSSNNPPPETQFQKHFARYSASFLADTSNPSTKYGTAANYPQPATQIRVPRPPISSIPIHSQNTRYNAQHLESEMASELEQMRVARKSFDDRSGRSTLRQQSQTRTGRPMQSGTDEMAWRQQQPRRNQEAYPYQQPQDMAQAPQHFRQRSLNLALATQTHSPPKPQISSQPHNPPETNAQPAILARQNQARQAQIQQQERIQQTRMQQQHQQARLNQHLTNQHTTNLSPYPPHPLAPTSMSTTPHRQPQLPIPIRYARGWNRYSNTTFQPLRWTAPPAYYPSANSNAHFSRLLSPREITRLRSMQMKGCGIPPAV